jgi:hypothetical protein
MRDALPAGDAYLTSVHVRLAPAIWLACFLAGTPAAAQFVPPPPALEGRIPAPLPLPPPPPVISGPVRQAPPPGVTCQGSSILPATAPGVAFTKVGVQDCGEGSSIPIRANASTSEFPTRER